MKRKSLFHLLKVIISLGLISVIFSQIDIAGLQTTMNQVKPDWLLLTVLLIGGGIIVRAKRWQILLRCVRVSITLKKLVMLYLIGFAFNNVLPSGIGGDAVRIVELRHYTNDTSDAVTSVVVERFLGLYGSCVLALVTLAFTWKTIPKEATLGSLILFGGVTIGGICLVHQQTYYWLQRFGPIHRISQISLIHHLIRSFHSYTLPTLAQSFAIGLLFNLILVGINLSIGLALSIAISPLYYFLFVPFISLSLTLPITFAGFGARETAYITLLSQVGVLGETALALSLLIYLLSDLLPGLVGGGLYLWRGTRILWLVGQQPQ